MPVCTSFLNPADSTETEYGPGFRKLTSKYPVWLVVALSETLVAVLVTTTAAPGTTEFCGSTTLPVILPRDSAWNTNVALNLQLRTKRPVAPILVPGAPRCKRRFRTLRGYILQNAIRCSTAPKALCFE